VESSDAAYDGRMKLAVVVPAGAPDRFAPTANSRRARLDYSMP